MFKLFFQTKLMNANVFYCLLFMLIQLSCSKEKIESSNSAGEKLITLNSRTEEEVMTCPEFRVLSVVPCTACDFPLIWQIFVGSTRFSSSQFGPGNTFAYGQWIPVTVANNFSISCIGSYVSSPSVMHGQTIFNIDIRTAGSGSSCSNNTLRQFRKVFELGQTVCHTPPASPLIISCSIDNECFFINPTPGCDGASEMLCNSNPGGGGGN